MCSSWVSFWYCSVASFFFMGFGSAPPSMFMLSLAISCKGFPPLFFVGIFFCFLALGGVFESREASCRESMPEGGSSSSLSGFGRFFVAGLTVFKVLCTNFFEEAFVAFGMVGFLAAGFAFAFYGGTVSLNAIESRALQRRAMIHRMEKEDPR